MALFIAILFPYKIDSDLSVMGSVSQVVMADEAIEIDRTRASHIRRVVDHFGLGRNAVFDLLENRCGSLAGGACRF